MVFFECALESLEILSKCKSMVDCLSKVGDNSDMYEEFFAV